MKNHLIISLLILSVGLSQQLIPQITETYKNGNVKSIIYHKKTRNGIEKVKEERYHEYGQKSSEGTYKYGKDFSRKCWDEDGNECDSHHIPHIIIHHTLSH